MRIKGWSHGEIRTEDAVGHVLCHDITQIIPGDQDAKFKKGHVVTEEDIPESLLSRWAGAFIHLGKGRVEIP